MILTLVRRWLTPRSTIGDLYGNGARYCFALEDPVRPPGVKIPGATAIPEGTYRVVCDWSPRFQRIMPHVLDVPGFTGIRIHAGNTAADTAGCILVGFTSGPDQVGQSQAAFEALLARLSRSLATDPEAQLVVVMRAEPR